MHIVTTMSYDQLGELIRNKRISLDNADLLFGYSSDMLDEYFKQRVGYSGYVVGLQGRLNKYTADILQTLDAAVIRGNCVLLESEIESDDAVVYSAGSVGEAAEALYYGLPEEDIRWKLADAESSTGAMDGAKFLCIPYLQFNGKLVVTSLTEELDFDVGGVKYVKVK